MSNVNADATQLLTILKNMRTSISSIETTRSSVKMKYQQLGIGWNDKKYDELGTIVKDCNKALNDILQIMLQAEKYVASLAKSVQEYDNVNLDTPSARNSFLQGLQTPNVGNSSYQYILDFHNSPDEQEHRCYCRNSKNHKNKQGLPQSLYNAVNRRSANDQEQ